MNSPKSDFNKSNPSSTKRKQRNSEKMVEMGPVTPITRFFFVKKTQTRLGCFYVTTIELRLRLS